MGAWPFGRERTQCPLQVGASTLAEVTLGLISQVHSGNKVSAPFCHMGITQAAPFFANLDGARRVLLLLKMAPHLHKAS